MDVDTLWSYYDYKYYYPSTPSTPYREKHLR
jgi:hypothetical protein